MAKTATAPLPTFAARNTREQVSAAHSHNVAGRGSIEERTAVLETRWEQTVPTLATKADLRDLGNRQLKWSSGAGIALLGVFAAVFIANTARMNVLDAKIDARLDALTVRQGKLNERIDKLDAKIDARFDALLAEIRALRRAE